MKSLQSERAQQVGEVVHALRHGQRPTTELVDAYNIQSTQVRNLLVRTLSQSL
ncbi:hypothetical protein [Streptomyces mirabilis]|uniref:hypothetical protein n=1 Tax=Streptomyces mirabilis TaxID=68239 RepID=UPI003654B5FB